MTAPPDRRSAHGSVDTCDATKSARSTGRTTCRVTACEPGREFGFEVLVGDRPVNNWHYRFTPAAGGGTEVTESFRMNDNVFTKIFGMFGGQLRTRRNTRDMRKTLERIKAVVETSSDA